MTGFVRPALALGLAVGLAACGPTRPAAIGPEGTAAPAGGSRTGSLDVSVGTGGVAGSVSIGDGAVRDDFGRNGWRLEI